MTDESFRLTPLDVRRYEFGKTMRGYDPARVDQFKVTVFFDNPACQSD